MPELPPSESLRSKGFTLKGALAYVEAGWGSLEVARVVDHSDEEAAALLAGHVLPSGWYPFRIQVALYETIDRLLGAGDLALCWEIGKFTSEYEMTRIHKAFLKIAGLDLWVRTASRMWSRYYNAGGLEVEEIGKSAGSVVVSGFNPISKAFCYDFGGWLHRTVELAGFERVRIEHRDCLLDGASGCRYTGSWS